MIPLCLTQGDPSGIGPDLALLHYLRARESGDAFFILADPALLRRRAALLGLEIEIIEVEPEQAARAFASGLPVAPLNAVAGGEPGRPDKADAAATIESIRRAVDSTPMARQTASSTLSLASW
jgi:4-hydroxythreonine-4-phosphate dehydrogenase